MITNLPAFIRRDVERAIADALHPKGMSAHEGIARIKVDQLQYLLRMIELTDIIPIPSPSAICALLGCKTREPHDHEVIER